MNTVNSMHPKLGDKVRIKKGRQRGARGRIVRANSGELAIRLDPGGQVVRVPNENVTNFSLAARKAWVSMPTRRVGRPKGSGTVDRISVTFRVDRDLWNRFKEMEAAGTLHDRTEAVNNWLSELTRLSSE